MQIANLSLVTEIGVQNTDKVIKVDFTDKRFVNKLLHLVKKYQNIEDEIEQKLAGIDSEELDELDKFLKFSDVECELLTEFKDDVDSAFNTNITEQLYGDCLPSIERYFDLFESLTPYIVEAKKKENEKIVSINERYGMNRIKTNKTN